MLTRRTRSLVAIAVVVAGAGFMFLALHETAKAMTGTAQSFLGSLSAEQRKQATMAFDNPARTDWHYIPKDTRKGLQIKEMNADQRKRATALLQSGLSEIGYEKASTIMSLEAILRELEKSRSGGPIRDPERYYFTVFGVPTDTGRWGWSLEGHHLSLNFTVDEGKVVGSTPTFFGSNPAEVADNYAVGAKKGTRPLVKEESLAFELLQSLSADQRKLAVIAAKAPDDVSGASQAQAKKSAPAGVPAEKLSAEQLKILAALLASYARNMPRDLADDRLEEIEQAGIGKVHFAWAGADRPGIGHYYRVQGPTFVIEFVNVQPDAAGNPANHIHCLWRSLKGDFGVKE